jgi:uncharacterized membrane protein YagU involved in acid resistance
MRNTGRAIVQGLLGGAAGAGCMSALRFSARRAGVIDYTPPQATRARLLGGGMGPRTGDAAQLTDALVHLGIGAAGGVGYGVFVRRGETPRLATGALYGFGVWAGAFGLLAPRLGITRSPLESSWQENLVNVAAHLLYGAVTALVAGELAHQSHPRSGRRALRARVG